MEKLLPHCIEAEQAVIGSILVDPDCWAKVRSVISPDDFFRESHKWIFEAIEAIAPAIDQLTVAHALGIKGKLESVGGIAYLHKLIFNTPTSVNAGHYANTVAETSYRRKLIDMASRISAAAYSGEGNSEEINSQSHQLLAKLDPPGKHSLISPAEHADRMLAMITTHEQQTANYLTYGYRDLDLLIGGMYPGDLVLLGARPSVGKSQLMLEVAHHNGRLNRHVLFVSCEMSITQIAEREVSMSAGIDIRTLRRGKLQIDEWDSIQSVVSDVGDMPLSFLCGKCGVSTIRQRATVLKQTTGLDLIIVDYLQLLKDKNDRKCGDNLRERIGYISGELKNLAMELDITILTASQFSRDVEYRHDHRPRMSDLRESGDLEQDADVILLMHRPELYDPNSTETGLLEIGVAKVRQGGQTGIVRLQWIPGEHRYRDAVR